MILEQNTNQPVDISIWLREEEVFPEGKRAKTSVFCPSPAPHSFLEASHRYIYKKSPDWAPEQFWVEIFAYRLGVQMQIDVPPTFAAFDSQKNNQCGALIRWFLEKTTLLLGEILGETYIRGGDLCQERIIGFNRHNGEQHNFETVVQIFNDLPQKYSEFQPSWKIYWAKAFLFDALIGNTDRHQDNWGIIEGIHFKNPLLSLAKKARISPVYDNGSSMGYEVLSRRFQNFENPSHLEHYVLKGQHHIRWSLEHLVRMEHCKFLKELVEIYPEMKHIMLECLGRVNNQFFKDTLDELSKFEIPVLLSYQRSNFMLKLINFRYQRLLKELDSD